MNACSFVVSAPARTGQTELPSGLRNPCSRRHLAEQIAVPGALGDVQEALAVARLDPGLDGDDLALARLADGADHGLALRQQLEILERRVHERAPPRGSLVDRLLRLEPYRVDRLRTVMQSDLVLWRLGKEEPGVEAP